MSYEDTTRKMADEVAVVARRVADEAGRDGPNQGHSLGSLRQQVGDLAAAVAKLADCVARRFPETPKCRLCNGAGRVVLGEGTAVYSPICAGCGGLGKVR